MRKSFRVRPVTAWPLASVTETGTTTSREETLMISSSAVCGLGVGVCAPATTAEPAIAGKRNINRQHFDKRISFPQPFRKRKRGHLSAFRKRSLLQRYPL